MVDSAQGRGASRGEGPWLPMDDAFEVFRGRFFPGKGASLGEGPWLLMDDVCRNSVSDGHSSELTHSLTLVDMAFATLR